MKHSARLSLLGFLFFLSACRILSTGGAKDDHKITMTFVQVNDVYEIAPLNGGREGGMARVASLKKTWQKKNPNTLLVIAGDFLSPSVYNGLQYEGKPIRGRQMVEALNAAGMDIAIFGNHEFDIKEAELKDRINESAFGWISTNAFHKTPAGLQPFEKGGTAPFPQTQILHLTDADGTKAKIGLFAIVLPFNKATYVGYTDPLQTAKEAYNRLKDSVDAVVAITHQTMEEDERLARELPGLAAIIGGHEHDGRIAKVGNVPITKALANARNAYVVNLSIDTKKHSEEVETLLQPLNETVPLDSATNVVVQKWNGIAANAIQEMGLDAGTVVISKGPPLDGRETEVRSRPTNLSRLIVAAMQEAAPGAAVVVLNGGSIRVDDVVQLPVRQYDILRILPFGGAIAEADMKGSVVEKMLSVGRANGGRNGGYLHYNDNVTFDNGQWKVAGQPIDPTKTYRVALPSFLLTGGEANMDFLNDHNPDIAPLPPATKGDSKADIRVAIVQYLQRHHTEYRNE